MYESVDFNDFMMGMVVTLSIRIATKRVPVRVGWGGLYHKEERRDVVYLTHTVRIEEGNICSFLQRIWEGAGVIESTITILIQSSTPLKDPE